MASAMPLARRHFLYEVMSLQAGPQQKCPGAAQVLLACHEQEFYQQAPGQLLASGFALAHSPSMEGWEQDPEGACVLRKKRAGAAQDSFDTRW